VGTVQLSEHRWSPVDRSQLGIDPRLIENPYNLWRWLRPGSGRGPVLRFGVELRDVDEAEWKVSLQAHGLLEPPVYAADPISVFRTVTRAPAEVAQQKASPLPAGVVVHPGFPETFKMPAALSFESLKARLRSLGESARFSAAQGLMQLGILRPDPFDVRLQDRALSRGQEPVRSGAAAPDPARAPVIAVIDDTCAFLHPMFRKAGSPSSPAQSRFLAVWDQTDGRDPYGLATEQPLKGTVPPELGYGAELRREGINHLIELAEERDERFAYRHCKQTIPTGNWSHGTQVLALAAAARAESPDAASTLDLIAVQLPRRAVGHTHGLWLNSYVLDALRYILLRAPPDAPVIVNISLAGQVGAHDGTSFLEAAIDELIDWQKGRLTVVLAAGNARDAELHTHAVLKHGESTLVVVTNKADDDTPGFVECRLTSTGTKPEVSCKVAPRGGPSCDEVPANAAFSMHRGNPISLVGHAIALAARGPWSQHHEGFKQHALLAVAQTDTASGAGKPHGPKTDWTLEFKNLGQEAVEVHAWIVRDESLPGFENIVGTAYPLRFAGNTKATFELTMNSIAFGAGPIVVGAYLAEPAIGSITQRGMYRGSGHGSANRPPDLCASTGTVANLGDKYGQQSGIARVPFLSTDAATGPRIYGTSLAAPLVTRQLANLLMELQPPRWMARNELLSELKHRYPSQRPNLVDPVHWTSDFWL
jgi:Subtilase family